VLFNKPKSILSSNLVPSATDSGCGQLSFDQYDLSSDDEEYLTHHNEAEMTPGRSNRTAHLLTTPTVYFNSPSDATKNWGQINPNLKDYHSDRMENSSTFWILDITIWWCQ